MTTTARQDRAEANRAYVRELYRRRHGSDPVLISAAITLASLRYEPCPRCGGARPKRLEAVRR